MAICGALIVASLFGQMDVSIAALEFQLAVKVLTRGRTEIVIPPIGSISAATHWAPVKISLILRSIDLELLKDLLETGFKQQELIQEIIAKLEEISKVFIVRLLSLGALGGALGILVLRRKRGLVYVKGAAIGFLTIFLLLAGTYAGYDLKKFENPQFAGALKGAPWMMGLFQESLVKINILGKRMEFMANNLYTVFERLEHVEPIAVVSEDLKILHVSDIHNNPAAYDFLAQIINNFGVDIVIDTGDISDFGTPLEAQLVKRINEMNIPYLFVAGNHDSPQILEALSNIKNVLIVNDRILNINGLNIVGINDPASVSNAVTPPPEEKLTEYVARLNGVIQFAEEPPDLLMVHNPWLAKQFAGQIPLILFGHNHRYSIEESGGSVLIDAGTTGAAGIRGLAASNEVPYSLVLLTLAKDEKWHITAADTIKVYNLQGSYSIERRLFTP